MTMHVILSGYYDHGPHCWQSQCVIVLGHDDDERALAFAYLEHAKSYCPT
jgi:hypothetical protein